METLELPRPRGANAGIRESNRRSRQCPGWVVLSFALALLGAGIQARAGSPNAGAQRTTLQEGPRIRFAATRYDFGRVRQGEIVQCSFVFTNVGCQVLEIRDVVEGCGCTAVGTWPRQVEPGAQGAIPLEVDTARYDESLDKSVFVLSNDPQEPMVELALVGTVWTPVELTPDTVVFAAVQDAQTNDSRVVRLVSHLEAPLVLSPPICESPFFGAELRPVRAGREFELVVRTRPPLPLGTTRGAVLLRTSAAEAPLLTVTVVASVRPPVTVSPTEVRLPTRPLEKPMSARLLVRNQGTNDLRLDDLKTGLDGVRAELDEVQAGRLYQIHLYFPAGFDLASHQPAAVTLRTSHPRMPLLSVPIGFDAAAPDRTIRPSP